MKWTREPPTVPGWYWVRLKGASTPWMREFELVDGELLDEENKRPSRYGRCEFAGPIPEPEEVA